MKTITILTALTLVTGCGAQGATAHGGDGPGSQGASANVEANLARLRALHLFKVGNLVNQIPAEANCQGGPTHIGQACPGHEQEFAAGKAAAEERLAKLVARAEAAAASTTKSSFSHGPSSVGKSLAALRALAIVEIGQFETDQPESGSCYSLFCNESNQKRAETIEALVPPP